MRLSEAKAIAQNPSENSALLCLAHLKLGNAILRVMPSSPAQRELMELRGKIELMPRDMWCYMPCADKPLDKPD